MELEPTLKMKEPAILLVNGVYSGIAEESKMWDKQATGEPQAGPKRQRKGQLLLGFRENLGGGLNTLTGEGKEFEAWRLLPGGKRRWCVVVRQEGSSFFFLKAGDEIPRERRLRLLR